MIDLLKIAGFMLGLSMPPNGYADCGYLRPHYYCRVYFDWSGWVNVEGASTQIKFGDR